VQLLKGRFDNPLLAGAPSPILKTFFFKEAVDLQFLRFDLDSFWGRIGGGLNYLEVLPVSELCESKEHDICLPYYCGSPTPKRIKPTNVHCVGQEENLCDHNCTEPFNFGGWTETEKCSENCKLMLERTCEVVKVAGLTPMSCEDQVLVKEGNTSCKCAGTTESTDNEKGDSVSLGVPTILAICIGALIVLVIFVIAIIKMALKMEELKRRCNTVPEPKEERNLYYGLYYRSDGTRIDDMVNEAVDHNTDYDNLEED